MTATHFIRFKSNLRDDYVASEGHPPGKVTLEKILMSQTLIVPAEVSQLHFYGWDTILTLHGKQKIYCYLDPNADPWFIGLRKKTGMFDFLKKDTFDMNSFCNEFCENMKSMPELENVSDVHPAAEFEISPRDLTNVDTYFFSPALSKEDFLVSVKQKFPEANTNTSGNFLGDVRIKMEPAKSSSVFFYYDNVISASELSNAEENFLKLHFKTNDISAVHIRDQEVPEFEEYRARLIEYLLANFSAVHRKEIGQ